MSAATHLQPVTAGRSARPVVRRDAGVIDGRADNVDVVERVLDQAVAVYTSNPKMAETLLVFTRRPGAHLPPDTYRATPDTDDVTGADDSDHAADDRSAAGVGDSADNLHPLKVPTDGIDPARCWAYSIVLTPAGVDARGKAVDARYSIEPLGMWEPPLFVEEDPGLGVPLYARFAGPTGDRFCEGRWTQVALGNEFAESEGFPPQLKWFRRVDGWLGTCAAQMVSRATYRAGKLVHEAIKMRHLDGTVFTVTTENWGRFAAWIGKCDARAAGKSAFDAKLPTILSRTSSVPTETVIQQIGWGDGVVIDDAVMDKVFLSHGCTEVPGARVSLIAEVDATATYDGPGNNDYRYRIAEDRFKQDELAEQIRKFHTVMMGTPDVDPATVLASFTHIPRAPIGHPKVKGYARYGININGTTGTYKTSTLMASMAAWGEFDRDPIIAWGTATMAPIIGFLQRVGNAPAVIDDFNASSGGKKAVDLYQKLSTVSEMLGEGGLAPRGTQNGADRPTRKPMIDCMVVSTAETVFSAVLGMTESRVKRWMQFSMPVATNRRKNYTTKVIHPFCRTDRNLSRILREYLDWLAERRVEISEIFAGLTPQHWLDLTGPEMDLGHDRQNVGIIDMITAWEIWYMRFAVEAAGIPEEEANRMFGEVQEAFTLWAQAQIADADEVSTGHEGVRMLDNLRAAATAGKCYFVSSAGAVPETGAAQVGFDQLENPAPTYGWRRDTTAAYGEQWARPQQADLAGWVDAEYVYIWTEAAKRWLQGDAERAARTILERLDEAGLLVEFVDGAGKRSKAQQVRLNGSKPRVCRVLRSVFEQWDVAMTPAGGKS